MNVYVNECQKKRQTWAWQCRCCNSLIPIIYGRLYEFSFSLDPFEPFSLKLLKANVSFLTTSPKGLNQSSLLLVSWTTNMTRTCEKSTLHWDYSMGNPFKGAEAWNNCLCRDSYKGDNTPKDRPTKDKFYWIEDWIPIRTKTLFIDFV